MADPARNADRLFSALAASGPAEDAYRAALCRRLRACDDTEALRAGTNRLVVALRNMAHAWSLVRDDAIFDAIVVLPTQANIFVNLSIRGEDRLVVSHGFVDLMMYHHRAEAAFRMCEDLATRQVGEVAGSRVTRAGLYMAHLDLIGRWLKEPVALDDLPAAQASPAHLNEEANVLLQGMLFLMLHEQAHSALGHRGAHSAASNLAHFNLATMEHVDGIKTNELAADAWAARAMTWHPEHRMWQAVAIIRTFLLVGLGQAANGHVPATHPYVSNRLAHLSATLQSLGVELGAGLEQPGPWLANEYDAWRARTGGRPTPGDTLNAIGLLSVEAAKLWISHGGDAALLVERDPRTPPVEGLSARPVVEGDRKTAC